MTSFSLGLERLRGAIFQMLRSLKAFDGYKDVLDELSNDAFLLSGPWKVAWPLLTLLMSCPTMTSFSLGLERLHGAIFQMLRSLKVFDGYEDVLDELSNNDFLLSRGVVGVDDLDIDAILVLLLAD
jgi:hypothetical protein